MSLRSLAFCGLLSLVSTLEGCAGTECNFHSQCERLHYCVSGQCRQDCQRDFDCAAGLVCTAIGRCEAPSDGGGVDGGPGSDSGPPPPPRDSGPTTDSGPPPLDSGPVPMDSGLPPRDSGPPPPIDSGPSTGTGRYLDRCVRASDCASGSCVDDVGGSHFCSRSCAAHSDCADEHACVGSVCVHDDTGSPCPVSSPASCNTGLCLGPPAGTGACTRECGSASDCPAGYACTDTGGGRHVCVDIERSCTAASDCLTGLCIPGLGCTATCRTVADCPAMFASLGIASYTCAFDSSVGGNVCEPPPPPNVVGDQPAGAICAFDGLGRALCRSGACGEPPDFPSTPPSLCTQACDAEGGCGSGLACSPVVEGASILLACVRAGSRALGSACSRGLECDSGLCDGTSSRCTRLCADGLCPTGWRCETIAGFAVSLCRP